MLDLSQEYLNIFNNIDGFLVIDTNERIVYMADNLVKQMGYNSFEDVRGKNIRDVIPTNNTYKILRSGKKQIGEMYFVEGYTIVSNGYPIYKGGQLVGAFEYDVFANIGLVEEFLEQVETVGRSDIPLLKRNYSGSIKAKYSIDDIKGSSLAINNLKKDISIVAKSPSTVLITGETGSGKELVAHSIHRLSQRSLFNFVSLNCAAIPNELFESELFGYEDGSFTGAKKGGKLGKAEIADSGTLFLDEIDTLTLGMQAKILRFLQEKEIYRVGGDFAIPVNDRIIAATNKDPEELMESNKLRRDLYYRLNVIELRVPPLRERLEDIPEITQALVENICSVPERGSRMITSIDTEVYELLMEHDWPGNIRELSNVVERAVNRCFEDTLRAEHFIDFEKKIQNNHDITVFLGSGRTLKEIKNDAEKQAVKDAIRRNRGNITKASAELGISRQMLHRKIRENGLNVNKSLHQ